MVLQSERRGTGGPGELRYLASVGGIAFGILTIAGWAFWARPSLSSLTGTVPSLSASPRAIARYYGEHPSSVRIAALLGSVALMPFLCFLVGLYDRLRRSESEAGSLSLLALLSGLMVCVVHFLFLSLIFVTAFNPAGVSPDVTAEMHYAGTAGAAASVLYATMLLAVGCATLWHRALPRWIGIAALIAAPLQLLYIPSMFGVQGIFDVTRGVLGVYVPFGSFLLWSIAAGIAVGRLSTTVPRPVTSELPPSPVQSRPYEAVTG